MGIAEIRDPVSLALWIAWIACPWRVLKSEQTRQAIAYLRDAWRSIEFDPIFCLSRLANFVCLEEIRYVRCHNLYSSVALSMCFQYPCSMFKMQCP